MERIATPWWVLTRPGTPDEELIEGGFETEQAAKEWAQENVNDGVAWVIINLSAN